MSKRDRKRAVRRRGRTERQRRARRAEAQVELLYDPTTAPERAATILHDLFGRGPVDLVTGPTIAMRGGMERARAVAEAALRREPDVMALSLAADVAAMDARPADAERHVVDALRIGDDPELHLRLATIRTGAGRLAEAVDGLDAELREKPGLEALLLARGEVLELLERAGSAASPEERRVLDRFRDRAPMRELQVAVGEFVAASPERTEAFAAGLEGWVEAGAVTEEELERWTDRAEADPAASETGRLQLMGEWAWVAPLLDGPAEEPGPLLAAFAADPANPSELRRRADDWLGWALWGMWEVARPEAAPGILVTDLVTGLRMYVEVPPGLLTWLPRWSVLLGQMIPVDGVWRAGDWFEVATPAEARELLHSLIDGLLDHAADFGREGRALIAWADEVHDDLGPLWLSHSVDPPSSEAIGLSQSLLRALLPGLVANLRHMQGMADEEPARWYGVDLEDPPAAWRALAASPRFVLHDDELVWLAEPDELVANGHDHDDDEDGDEHDGPTLVRASLSLEEGGLVVAPDSSDDLEELLELLGQLGHPGEIGEEGVIDESVESPVTLPEVPADELAAWLDAWPDEPLDELEGASPREAVADGMRSEVEALIRYLENEADRHRLSGLATDALRRELGLLDEKDGAEDPADGAEVPADGALPETR